MIKIIAIGKLKEKYLLDLCNDYKQRINKYHKIEIIEIKDSNMLEEAKEIKKYLNNNDYKVALSIKGNKLSTIEFKDFIASRFASGNPNIIFIIGGSDGLTLDIYNIVDKEISFSNMTFPHGLFRGILLEQIYRTLKIMNNETYHK